MRVDRPERRDDDRRLRLQPGIDPSGPRACRTGRMAGRIHYDIRDINQIVLPRGQYDFVVAEDGPAPLRAVGTRFEQVRLSLKPGGVFLFNDFIGPSRFSGPTCNSS